MIDLWKPCTPFALAALAALGSCRATAGTEGQQRVDELVASVTRTRAEAVATRDALRETLSAYHTILADQSDDMRACYERVVEGVDTSDERVEELEGSAAQMNKKAESFFAHWTKSLDAYQSPKLRRRSLARLEQTKLGYERIRESIAPASTEIEELLAELRDHLLFLEHDLNPTGIAALRAESAEIDRKVAAVTERLEAAVAAADAYTSTVARSAPQTDVADDASSDG
jgi:hypothetical protein